MRAPLPAVSAMVIVVVFWTVGSADDALIGVDGCRSCHAQAYAQWAQTPHAAAFDRLVGAEREDPRCVSCHATDAGRGLLGVQCESCHGPGRYYWPAAVMRDRGLAEAVGLWRGDDPQICARCHTADQPTLRSFDPSTALKAVRHRPNGGR